MKKQNILTGILCAIPLSALALVFYCLETYHKMVHNESAFFVCAYCILAFSVSTIIWFRARKISRGATVIWTISVAVLIFVFYVGSKIPFCVVCDQVTAEDLGFLIYWIQPEGMIH